MGIESTIKNAKNVLTVGIGKNSEKAVADYLYIFREKLGIKDSTVLEDESLFPVKKYELYICCTYDRQSAQVIMDGQGLKYGKEWFFAEDTFFLLDDRKNCRIAYLSYPGSFKSRLKAVLFGYAARHGKILPRERYGELLKGRSVYTNGNRFSRHLPGNRKPSGSRLIYLSCLFFGIAESIPQISAKKSLYEKYEYICFYDVSEAVKFRTDYPALAEKVITVEELKTHTMASLYMRAVYFDKRQNGCLCDTPLKTLWIGPKGTTRLCGCPDYLDISLGNAGVTDCRGIWESTLAGIIRLSVINNTYTFCSRDLCRKFNANEDGTELLRRKDISENTDHPDIIKIANDYTCNLHCPSCRKSIHAKNDEKTEREIDACTQALLKSGWLEKTDSLVIGASGETFLSPSYRRILYDGIVKRNSISVMTNGTLFTPQEWEKMEGKYDSLRFSVSIDAATKGTYEKVRCGGNFDRLMKNMEFLSGLRKEGKVDEVIVNMIVQKANYKEIPDFIRWAKKLGFDGVYLSHIWNWGTFTEDEFENNVSMFDKNGNMKPELARILEDPVCRDPIVDMRWDG
ncbi:MAG: hypothetical protein K5879_00010 [Lachnospiraceae bacterium]|nr:hypothetical protein [Lachnospiraceae bacterium]